MFKPVQNQQGTNNILGINLDAERMLMVYGSLTGAVYETLSAPTISRDSFSALLDQVTIEADKLISLVQAQRLPLPDRVSVAITGDYENESGILRAEQEFPGMSEVPLRSQLAVRFNLPVYVEQKANAGALAEYHFGKGKTLRNLIFVSLDPVLRLGILTDGKVYRNLGGSSGNIGVMQTELKHPVSGLPFSFNQICSSTGMLRTILGDHLQHWDHKVSLEQIIIDANQGDPYALESFERIAIILGKSLANATLLLRPDIFILGYPGCLLGETMANWVRRGIADATGLVESKLPLLASSELGAHLPELQALAPAINAFKSSEKA